MKSKYTLLFILAVLALLASEYVFLIEISKQHTSALIIGSGAFIILSLILVVYSYKKMEDR